MISICFIVGKCFFSSLAPENASSPFFVTLVSQGDKIRKSLEFQDRKIGLISLRHCKITMSELIQIQQKCFISSPIP
jgi:hypothetical protein